MIVTFTGVGAPAVYRGTFLFLGAIISLLFIDHDEGQEHPGNSHAFSNLSSWLDFADHKVTQHNLHNGSQTAEKNKAALKILAEKAMKKRLLRRPTFRWRDNIRMDLEEIGMDALDCM